MRCDSEHVRAIRTAIHLHGVTIHFNTTRPLPAYFELGGLTPAYLRYAGVIWEQVLCEYSACLSMLRRRSAYQMRYA